MLGFWTLSIVLFLSKNNVLFIFQSPELKDRGCDTVLPGQGCSTSQRAVINGCGAMVGSQFSEENGINSKKHVFWGHFVHHESHTKSPGIKPKSPK
jgi:hypothetical protein